MGNESLRTLRELSIGLDSFFEFANNSFQNAQSGFPPYNLWKKENGFTLELALAGYAKEDISINHQENVLSIFSKKQDEDTARTLLHKGISNKMFAKSFTLADNVFVKSAAFTNGMLTIELERIIPEEKKIKTITIN